MLIIWLIVSIVLILAWELLGHIIPEGWKLIPVNIFFFLVSTWIGALGYFPLFRQRISSKSLAWLCALILWFIVFVMIRSVLFPI